MWSLPTCWGLGVAFTSLEGGVLFCFNNRRCGFLFKKPLRTGPSYSFPGTLVLFPSFPSSHLSLCTCSSRSTNSRASRGLPSASVGPPVWKPGMLRGREGPLSRDQPAGCRPACQGGAHIPAHLLFCPPPCGVGGHSQELAGNLLSLLISGADLFYTAHRPRRAFGRRQSLGRA